MTRRLVAALVILAALVPAAPASASVPVITIAGKGWGHGVGLSQEGALAMALDGATVEQILGHFYPGTALGTASGPVRVVVHTVGSETVLAFPGGGSVRSPILGEQRPGFPVDLPPGGQVRIRFDGAYRVQVLGPPAPPPARAVRSGGRGAWQLPIPTQPPRPTTTAAPPPPSTTTTTGPADPAPTTTRRRSTTTTTAAGDEQTTTSTAPPTVVQESVSPEPVWGVVAAGGTVAVPERGRRYRGTIQAVADASGLRLVNHVDVEDYLRGMGEVRDPSWPQPALAAQAIVARTYALRAMQFGELCDDQRCQVYLGQQAEYGAMDWAVGSTRGRVLGFRGALASAVYSANAGGISATTLEGFGTPDGRYPYLRATRYPTRDPFPWKVQVSLADLGRRFGYTGEVTGARVASRGKSGRALAVAISGDAGTVKVDGRAFASGLGLRSTLFRLRAGEASKAPPAPKAADLIQALPDDAEALARTRRPIGAALRDQAAAVADEAAAAPSPVTATTARDAAVWGVLAVGIVTAAAMARFGLVPPGAATAGSAWPVLARGPRRRSARRRTGGRTTSRRAWRPGRGRSEAGRAAARSER